MKVHVLLDATLAATLPILEVEAAPPGEHDGRRAQAQGEKVGGGEGKRKKTDLSLF